MDTEQQPKKVSARNLADRVGAEPGELRRWLRAEGLSAGPGRRYAFTAQESSTLAGWYMNRQERGPDAS